MRLLFTSHPVLPSPQGIRGHERPVPQGIHVPQIRHGSLTRTNFTPPAMWLDERHCTATAGVIEGLERDRRCLPDTAKSNASVGLHLMAIASTPISLTPVAHGSTRPDLPACCHPFTRHLASVFAKRSAGRTLYPSIHSL